MLFADRLEVWNPGAFPPSITPDTLREPHPSIPANRLIAQPLFLAGYIEQMGTGTLDMIKQCKAAGLKPPEFRQAMGQVMQTLWRPQRVAVETGTAQVTPEVTPEVAKLLPLCGKPASRRELQQRLALKDDDHFRVAYLIPAIADGFLEMTIP